MKKSFFGFLLLLVFLTPLSINILNDDQISLSQNVANAGIFDAAIKSVEGGVLTGIGNTLGNGLLSFAAGFTWLSGELLNLSLDKTVFGMASWINNGGLGGTINIAWSLIRDICNLAFIFGFIYVGIRTILDPDHADTKRFVSRIIIGALLINFSLFFVKVIVDFANFTSFQIYNSMTNGGGNISTTITDMLGLVTLYDITSGDIITKLGDGHTGFWFFALGALLLLITTFVFLAASILLIVRFVALILIMVFSPILFATTVFPQTASYASDLWGKLISYAFFAPVYLLLTLISLTLLSGLNVRGGNFGALVKTGTAPEPGALDVVLNFSIIIFFMIASLVIARRMGIQGGDYAVSKTKMLIGASTAGLAARAGRATVGRWSQNMYENDKFRDAASKGGARGWATRQIWKGTGKVGDASLDARAVGGAGKAMGIGTGRKGGYKTVLEEVKAEDEKLAKSLGEVKDDDIRVMARKKEVENSERELKKLKEELKHAETQGERERLITEIEHKEHEVHDAQVKHATEKQRRVLGSTYSQPESADDIQKMTDHGKAIKDFKGSIENQWKEYAKLNDEAQKENARTAIEQSMKQLAWMQKEHDTFLLEKVDRGFAGVLDSSTILTAWPQGRLVTQEKESGKALRKARKDGFPKEKAHSNDAHGHGKDDHDDHAPAHAPAKAPSAGAPAGGGHDAHH